MSLIEANDGDMVELGKLEYVKDEQYLKAVKIDRAEIQYTRKQLLRQKDDLEREQSRIEFRLAQVLELIAKMDELGIG